MKFTKQSILDFIMWTIVNQYKSSEISLTQKNVIVNPTLDTGTGINLLRLTIQQCRSRQRNKNCFER